MYKWEEKINLNFGLLCLLALVILTLVQIFARTFLPFSLKVSELSKYLLITLTFISSPYLSKTNSHIKMDDLVLRLPTKIIKWKDLLLNLSAAFLFGVISIGFFSSIKGNWGTLTEEMEMPFPLYFLPSFLGFFLMSIEYIIKFILQIKKTYNKP